MDELWGEGHPYPSPYAFDLPPVFPILPPTFLPSSHLLFCSLSGEEDLLISLFRTKDIRILTGPYFKVGLLFQNPWEDSFVHLLPGANTSWACFLQFSSVTQSCLTLCNPMNRSTPGLPVHHQLLEFTQTYIHRVGNAIQPSYPLSSPSPPAPNPSQHQSLFHWVNSSHEVAKVLEFQL